MNLVHLKNKQKRNTFVVHTTTTETLRGELVRSDLPQDRIYGFVPRGKSFKVSKSLDGIKDWRMLCFVFAVGCEAWAIKNQIYLHEV